MRRKRDGGWKGRAGRWLALLALVAAHPASAQVGAVPVRPMRPSPDADQWKEGRARPGACIDAVNIAGAEVVDQRTLDIVLRGGQRWRLKLQNNCPQITFYGGFYYNQTQTGRICAGRDRIIGRAGGNCSVRAIAPLTAKKR